MNHKPRINIITGEHSNWHEGIEKARAFFCYVSHMSLHNPLLVEQLTYAEQLGKPIRVFVEQGTQVPEGFLTPFTDLQVFVTSSPEEIADITMRLMREASEEDMYG